MTPKYYHEGRDVFRWNAKEKDYVFYHRAARICEAKRDVEVGNGVKKTVQAEEARKSLMRQIAFNASEPA